MEYPDRQKSESRENAAIGRFRNGETAAFAELAELYKDRIHRFIACILGPDREAEDIAQEAFVQMYRSLGSFKGGSSFGTWAYAVTRNVCRRRLRARGRETPLFDREEEGPRREPPDPAPSQDAALESAETKALVRSAVDGLPPIHRAVIFLSCWEGLSYAEIAEALEIPVGTVRSRLHNAMLALERRLGPAPGREKRKEQ